MAKDKLRELIVNLHEELGAAKSIDEQSRVLLRQLVHDVEDLAGSDVASSEKMDSAAGQLRKSAVEFETDHPKLSMALGELMDALGKLGI